ncbi:type II secretion system F family protein [Rubellimicrobium arenae]|uniref:type II secretion system F family protein n=1 Tax=Rubellimicrobium arenae TaxID=2817372 RepID=UPI001B30C62E|nr:type II secretion system F family protein [Rubellimicrobium arenae]
MIRWPEALIYGLIAVAVLILTQGAYLAAFGREIRGHRRVNRRFGLLSERTDRKGALDQLRKEMTQQLAVRRVPVYDLLADQARRADIAIPPRRLLGLMALISVAALSVLTLATDMSLLLRAAIAAATGPALVLLWLGNRAGTRAAMIEEQLPDAVELMVRSLRVGHPFSASLAIVSREIPAPLGTEMGVISDEAAYGRDLGESLRAMAERIGLQDLRFLAMAVSIQAEAGGNLVEILDNLAKVIRARFRLFRRVRAITAEAKWSGTFLSAFPVVALVGIQLADPHYYDKVRTSAYFLPACLIVAGLLILNVIVMRALVNIKV